MAAPEKPASPDLADNRTAASGARMSMPVDGKVVRAFQKDDISVSRQPGAPPPTAPWPRSPATPTRCHPRGAPFGQPAHRLCRDRRHHRVEGRAVSRGQTIAKVRAADPAFLHFQVREDDQRRPDGLPELSRTRAAARGRTRSGAAARRCRAAPPPTAGFAQPADWASGAGATETGPGPLNRETASASDRIRQTSLGRPFRHRRARRRLAATLLFGVRSALFWANRHDRIDHEQPVAAWMTPGYIAHSWYRRARSFSRRSMRRRSPPTDR
ncbi:MAG: hypothetical protein R3D59_17795 [Paracoccaceae bacterium]